MIELLNSTKNLVADQCIIETLSKAKEKYDGIISSYVSGSYANDYAVPTSDIDLYLIFDRDITKELYEEIGNFGEELNLQIDMDLIPRSLEQLKIHGIIEMNSYFLHVWGKSVHNEIPNPSLENEIYLGMHGGYLRMGLTRKEKLYHFPLKFPSNSPLSGYDWREMTVEGVDEKSIKEIVVLTGWMATGLISWKASTFVPTKKHCPKLFKEHIGGEIAKDFEEITNYCRNQYHYLIPKSQRDYDKLVSLLPKVLSVENYFLKEYQDFLIENLENSNPIRARTSIIRLGEIIYPNDKSLQALSGITPHDESHAEKLSLSISALKKYS